MSDFDSIDDFVNHDPSTSSGQYLKGWKKDGQLDFWLSRKKLPTAVWVHSVPMLIVSEKDGRTSKRIYGRDFVCHEKEDVLKASRDWTKGKRDKPPCACGICKLQEWLERGVGEEKLKWTDPLFRIEGADDPKENVLIHVGGFYGGFGKKRHDIFTGEWHEHSQQDKDDLSSNHVVLAQAWKENASAKCKYIIQGVDNDDVATGLQKMVESDALGRHIKRVIKEQLESEGVEKGDPRRHPYAIRFKYDDKETFDKKYNAHTMRKLELTKQIDDLISGAPLDISKDTTPFNQGQMRAILERNCVLKGVPWDELFGEPSDDFNHGANEKSDKAEPKADDGGAVGRAAARSRSKKKDEPKYAEPCECGAKMLVGQLKCTECGAEYELEAPAAETTKDNLPFGQK